MRSRALLAACAMAATVLAGCAMGHAPVDMAAPDWSSGFAWTYAYEHSWEESWQEEGERGNESDRRQGRVVHEVLNTSLSADGEPLYVLGVLDAEGSPEIQVVRQRDLSRLPFGWSQSSQCSNGDCIQSFALRNVRTEAPTLLDFPLQNGKRWGGPVGADHEPQMVYEARVEGAARVDTPLGPITAARITIHAGPEDAAAFERAIRSEAQAAGYKVDALRIDLRDRQVLYYSDEYQAIVLHQRESFESFYARGSDPEGEDFEFRGSEKEQYRSVIEGARLVARPERSMGDVGRFMAGHLPIRDPTGQVVADVGYKLGIDPPQAVVNAAHGGHTNFTVAVEGDRPEDLQLRWTLVSEQGAVVSEGSGDAFSVETTTPGAYTVEVESVQEEQVVAAAGAILVAHWHRVDELDCGALGVPGCPAQALPVLPGAQGLYVRATPQGPLPDVGDSLQVYDNAGTAIQGQRNGEDFIVDLESLDGYLVTHEPWNLHFNQGLAVASPVEVEVQILYGPAGESDPATQVARLPRLAPWS